MHKFHLPIDEKKVFSFILYILLLATNSCPDVFHIFGHKLEIERKKGMNKKAFITKKSLITSKRIMGLLITRFL